MRDFLPLIQEAGQWVRLSSNNNNDDNNNNQVLSLVDLIGGNDIGAYFTYHGSLTRPPCYNTVTWIVLEKKMAVDELLVSLLKNNIQVIIFRIQVFQIGACLRVALGFFCYSHVIASSNTRDLGVS